MANNEVSDHIEEALGEVMHLLEDHEEGDMIIEWVLIAHLTNPEGEKGSQYPVLVSNGLIPTHRLKGLLVHTLDKLR